MQSNLENCKIKLSESFFILLSFWETWEQKPADHWSQISLTHQFFLATRWSGDSTQRWSDADLEFYR